MDERTPPENKPGAGLRSGARMVANARRFLKEVTAGLVVVASTSVARLRKYLTQPADVPGSPAAILANARRGLNKISAKAADVTSTTRAGLTKSLARQAEAPETPKASGPSPVTEAALASIVEVRQSIRPEFSPGGIVALIPSLVIFLLMIGLIIGAFFALNYARYFMAFGRLPY